MATLLLRHADLVVAMDDAESQWADGAVYCQDNRIVQVGPAGSVRRPAGARVVDVAGKTIIPGFVDVHSHM